jgi:hypothetical protein
MEGIMSDAVDEYNTFRVRASFKDDEASAVTPTSGTYRVDDITGGVVTSVVASTQFTPATTYYDIVIPHGANIILDQSHNEETRVVTVKFAYGAGRRGAKAYEYTLKNLRRAEALD